MKKLYLFTLTAISVTQLPAMEKPTPPPIPERTVSLPGYRKPLPALPVKKAAAQTVQITLPEATHTITTNKPNQVILTAAQEKSIQKITDDINKLMENNTSIAKHAIELGKLGSSNIFGSAKEGGILIKKLALSSASVANIYLKMDAFANASPEVKNIARKRILAVVNSPEFKASEVQLIELAADNTLPSVIREPLRALARQLAELPGIIIKKYLPEQYEQSALEAR